MDHFETDASTLAAQLVTERLKYYEPTKTQPLKAMIDSMKHGLPWVTLLDLILLLQLLSYDSAYAMLEHDNGAMLVAVFVWLDPSSLLKQEAAFCSRVVSCQAFPELHKHAGLEPGKTWKC